MYCIKEGLYVWCKFTNMYHTRGIWQTRVNYITKALLLNEHTKGIVICQ
jgi:hypothetical protein